MSKRRGGGRSRIHARDQKYTGTGFDPGVPEGDQTILLSHAEKRAEIVAYLKPMTTQELDDLIQRMFGQPVTIEGEFQEVETRPDRLLAGGPES